MYTRDQYIFVVGPIENTKFSALGKCYIMAPKIIVPFFTSRWGFKTVNHYPTRIKIFKHLAYQTVFSGSIHSLNANQNRIFAMCIKPVLKFAEFFPGLFQC